MKFVEQAKTDLRNDVTWNRVARYGKQGAKRIPQGSVYYVLDRFPIIGWLPKYNPRWLINDFIAGLTIGLMLIPQGLSYAKIAEIPVEYGLMSSWLPSGIYAFMGTTKDLSTGPTSLIGLLTSENVHVLGDKYTPSEIASAMAFMMGIYGMIFGFFELGFLLEFISLPVLSGFISAVAITIILNQMDSLLGEQNVGDGTTASQIRDIFGELPNANGYACAIGFSGILFLTLLDQAGKRWGKKNKVIWLFSITRAFLALVLFTGVSYAVNKDRAVENHLFNVVKVEADGQEAPRLPNSSLIGEIASRSVAVFFSAAVEHVAIARAFSVRNNYTTDQSLELGYFGVTNFFNSFFHAMGVGGAMSRSAVNSASGVKSPLSGFVTTAVVLICVYFLVGTLYWIPSATLAAIIITAVWPLISGPSVFYKYWKTSLADWIASMIALWVSLFVSAEIGIAAAVGFNIVYVLLRQVFVPTKSTGSSSFTSAADIASTTSATSHNFDLPADTRLFTFNESLFFPNSFRNTARVLDDIKTYHAPHYNGSHGPETERNWSVVGERRVTRLRKAAGVEDATLPPIGLVVLDFGRVNFVDSTAVTHLKNLKAEIRKYGGKDSEIRFVGMSESVKHRFERAGWPIAQVGSEEGTGAATADPAKSDVLYGDVGSAVLTARYRDSRNSVVSENTMKPTATHDEQVDEKAADKAE